MKPGSGLSITVNGKQISRSLLTATIRSSKAILRKGYGTGSLLRPVCKGVSLPVAYPLYLICGRSFRTLYGFKSLSKPPGKGKRQRPGIPGEFE